VRPNRSKNTRIITQISENEYLLEGQSDWARFGCQTDPSIITSANLDGGPFLLVNDSFLGKGRITQIQNIESEIEDYFVLKITIHPYETRGTNDKTT
jgi:hypothetical protein